MISLRCPQGCFALVVAGVHICTDLDQHPGNFDSAFCVTAVGQCMQGRPFRCKHGKTGHLIQKHLVFPFESLIGVSAGGNVL